MRRASRERNQRHDRVDLSCASAGPRSHSLRPDLFAPAAGPTYPMVGEITPVPTLRWHRGGADEAVIGADARIILLRPAT